MNKKKFWPIVPVGGILLLLSGALWAVRALPSQAAQPTPPLAELLLHKNDLPDLHGLEWEQSEAQAPEELAREIAKFTGLSLEGTDFLEGRAVFFLTYSGPHSDPKATGIVQGLYRYEGEQAAATRYEQLLQSLHLALERETSIISRSEWPSEGVRGQLIEAWDPIDSASAYWFVGVQGDLVTVVQVWVCRPLGPSLDSSDRAVLAELLPVVLERMARSQ
jgi:hypothetical protein